MKIKVLALSYLFPNSKNPGYGIFVFNRLKAVAKKCDVKVIAPLQWFPLFNKHRRAAGGKGIGNYEKFGGLDVFYPRFLSIPKFFKWFDSVAYFFSVIPAVCHLKYKEKYDFDVVDVHWTYPDILAGYLISRIYRKKLIITIRGKEALYPGETGGRKMILDWLLKKADVVVNLSAELKDLVQQIGVKSDRAKVIYNGVDLEQFFYADKQDARKALGLPDDKKILLSVGSLIRRKGHHELIKMMPELSRSIDTELYIVGGVNPEGDYSAELKSLVSELGLSNVHFIDSQNHAQLKNWYAAADLFCLATIGEGCPNVVLEAMACGCPVVVSNVGAVPDLVRVGIDGVVVDVDNWNRPRHILTALQTTWNRVQIAQKMKNYSWDSCAEKVFETYQSILVRPKQMKILYHHRTLGDGAEGIHIREMVKAFRDIGHKVRVVGPAGESVPEAGGEEGILSNIKKLLPGAIFELCEIGYSGYIFLQMVWLIRSEKPDFIYDRYITFNSGCVFAAKILRIPLFLEVNAPLALERSEEPDEKLHFKKIAFLLERWICSNSYRTIVVSTPLSEYLQSIGVPGAKIVIMPNGVDPDKFLPRAKNNKLLERIGASAEDVIIGFTGVLRQWHGLDLLLEAVAKIANKGLKVFLLIVGDGPIRTQLEEDIANLGLFSRAYITGLVSHGEVPDYVNLFDIAVSPKATFYASPMKVVEYMALGKPVVVPNAENLLDLVDNGANGLAFIENDCEDLIDKLSTLIADRGLCKSYGNNAHVKVMSRLNWRWNAEVVCRMSIDVAPR